MKKGWQKGRTAKSEKKKTKFGMAQAINARSYSNQYMVKTKEVHLHVENPDGELHP